MSDLRLNPTDDQESLLRKAVPAPPKGLPKSTPVFIATVDKGTGDLVIGFRYDPIEISPFEMEKLFLKSLVEIYPSALDQLLEIKKQKAQNN